MLLGTYHCVSIAVYRSQHETTIEYACKLRPQCIRRLWWRYRVSLSIHRCMTMCLRLYLLVLSPAFQWAFMAQAHGTKAPAPHLLLIQLLRRRIAKPFPLFLCPRWWDATIWWSSAMSLPSPAPRLLPPLSNLIGYVKFEISSGLFFLPFFYIV